MAGSALKETLGRLVDGGVLRGVVVGVGHADGNRFWCHGEVTTQSGTRNPRADERFLLTSVAKPITATQILLLTGNGRLGIDDPISRYVPAYTSAGTVRHLLNHSSGISPDANLTEGPPTSILPDELIDIAATATSDWPPGTRTRYCSPGFWLVAEIVNVVSRMPYHRHLEVALTEPLGMAGTRYEPGNTPPDLVQHRTPRNNHLADQVRRLRYPAGGIVGTVPDLLTFGKHFVQHHLNHQEKHVIPETVLELIWDFDPGRLPASDQGERFHLGWQVGGPGTQRSERTLWHPGASGTALWIEPNRGATVAMLSADWYLETEVFGAVIDAALEDLDRSSDQTTIGGSQWT